MTNPVVNGLVSAGVPPILVDELVDAYTEAKRRYHLGDLRPSAVEGGRFSEAAFRILEWDTTGTFTPVGTTLTKVPTLVSQLEGKVQAADSVRFHIPRTLRAVYDIRNKRDIAHLADGIDPNFQDGTFVVHVIDWVLAEFVRLYNNTSPNEARIIIESIVSKEVPSIQTFDDKPVILKNLSAPNRILLLLYWKSPEPATRENLASWLTAADRTNYVRNISRLTDRFLVHQTDTHVYLTNAGIKEVEEKKLVDPTP